MKKKFSIVIICVFLIAVTAVVLLTALAPAAKGETGEDAAIKEAISRTLLTMRDVGKFTIEDGSAKAMQTGKISDLTSTQKDYLKGAYSEKLRESLSEDSPLIKRLEVIRNNVLNSDAAQVSSTIDNGVFDFEFITKEIAGDSGKAEVWIVGWQKYITEMDTEEFKVVFPVSKTEVTCYFNKVDGAWKVTDLEIIQNLFDGDIEKEKTFSTYEEAVKYANETMPSNIWEGK